MTCETDRTDGSRETDGTDGASTTPALSRVVAIEILLHGARSRARLASRLGLSAATLTRLVKPLVEAGVLVEADAVRTPGRGRSSLPLDVVPERYQFLGIKLTTEAIYAVATDLRARVTAREVVPLHSLLVPDVVAAVSTVVAVLGSRSDRPVDALGVTVGGQVERGGIVADSPYLQWHEVPFRELLGDELKIPVHLDNDVVGLTRAQHWFGHGRGLPSFALLTVGAGIGYGLVINDAMVPTLVNPVSHLPVDPTGPLCPLGHRGCLTAYLASDSIVAAVSTGHRRVVDYDEVLELAGAGDAVAGRVVAEAAHSLGRAAAAIVTLTGVERLILSGEGVHLAEVARESLRSGFEAYGVPHASRDAVIIRPMDFLEWARGAAVIAIQAEFMRPPRAHA